ncbi:hypothetical protein IMPR6_690207 [Imperialibacter sp. EC-SDR9]|nr:hypothetical protein IMPERIA89_340207 [Imperialibacter sp. 89]CAD5297017.1 hypothetical protein IMPERIA75_700207 [Imperialibacter sp. 75]VVT33996.1 hypothetical protein IMPR6_690207 [Imperialibacter sp. EC-SDR9]
MPTLAPPGWWRSQISLRNVGGRLLKGKSFIQKLTLSLFQGTGLITKANWMKLKKVKDYYLQETKCFAKLMNAINFAVPKLHGGCSSAG